MTRPDLAALERLRERFAATSSSIVILSRTEGDDILRLLDYVELLETDVWKTHVPVTGTQHDPSRGLLHGYCERCRTPWPCEWSPERYTAPDAGARGGEG